jgi:hypothetical protein
LLELQGLGKGIWQGVDVDEYLRRERSRFAARASVKSTRPFSPRSSHSSKYGTNCDSHPLWRFLVPGERRRVRELV